MRNGTCIIIFIVISALIFYPAFVSADIAVPGMVNKGITYVISNIKDYPGYIFIANSAIWGEEYATLVDSNGLFGGGGYKLDGYILVAIPADSIPGNVLADLKNGSDNGTPQAVKDFMKNSKGTIKSPDSLAKTKLVNEKIPLDSIIVAINIGNMSGKELSVSQKNITYIYKDGTTEKINIPASGELPDPTGKPQSPTKTPVVTKIPVSQKNVVVKITTIPFGLSVYLDNVLKGKSPLMFYTSFGNHQFVLNNGTFPMYVQSFEIKNNTPQIFNINLRDQASIINQLLFPVPATNLSISNKSVINTTKQ